MKQMTEAQAWREVARLAVEESSDKVRLSVPDNVAATMWGRWSFWTKGRDVQTNALAALWLAEEAEAESNG